MKNFLIIAPDPHNETRRRICVFLAAAVSLLSCGSQPPTLTIEPNLPPAPVVARMQNEIIYSPMQFFKQGETIIRETDAELRSLGDLVGIFNTPMGNFKLIIRAWADTAQGIQPLMVVKFGKQEIVSVRASQAAQDYEFGLFFSSGDTLRVILADDFYEPGVGDVNLHVERITFVMQDGSGSPAGYTLTWNANTEPDLAGYRVYFGVASRQYEDPDDTGLNTFYSLSSFRDGLTRYFAVTAYDTAGNESDFSNELAWAMPMPPDTTEPEPPGPPADTTLVRWPDTKAVKMQVVYQKRDAAGKPLVPKIRLQMERYDSLSALGYFDTVANMDYTVAEVNDSTAVISMNMLFLKAATIRSGGYWRIRFRIRLENPTDSEKITPWIYSNKSIQFFVAVDPREGVPLLPTFKILL